MDVQRIGSPETIFKPEIVEIADIQIVSNQCLFFHAAEGKIDHGIVVEAISGVNPDSNEPNMFLIVYEGSQAVFMKDISGLSNFDFKLYHTFFKNFHWKVAKANSEKQLPIYITIFFRKHS